MRRVAAGALALALAAIVGGFALSGAAMAAPEEPSESPLSENGKAAIADLRTCLASEDELSVYYLIDASQSLRVADDGSAGSDPEFLRAPILANSLEELSKLGDDATVSWAAGFFSDDFSTEIDWRELGQGGPAELESAIRSVTPAGYTNWPAALKGAQAELATQSGCKLLVWLTDGQLDLPPSDEPGDGEQGAFDDLCSESGVFNDFRETGVVVIGALLAATESAQAASGQMQRLVEGVNPAGQECGKLPMPDSYVHGAFVEATDSDDLRFVFLQLGAQVGGGYPHPFEADGSFTIDPGVSSFRIIADGDWTLHPPMDADLAPATSAEPQEWLSFDGANTIDVDIESVDMHGTWRVESAAARYLYLYSGLSLAFDETTSIVADEAGDHSIALGGDVLTRDGSPADLSVLDYELSAYIVSADGVPLATFEPLSDPHVDPGTGTISVMLPDGLEADTIVVQASIDSLRTKENGLELVAVTTQEPVEMVVPADYPLVTEVAKVSDLEGAEGTAEFLLSVTAPEGGGEICFDQAPVIASDGADREQSWEWGYPQGCTPVPAEGAQVRVTATNSTPADADVRAILPVTLKAAPGSDPAVYPDQNQNVELDFRTSHPTNAAAITGLVILLLVLGLLIPLLGLWLLNRFTSSLDVDSSLQRGSFAVRIQPTGIVFTDAPSSDAALSERFRYLTSADKVRSLDDPDAGRISAVVPWFPLLQPWYRVQPSSGRSIVVARTAARSGSAGDIRSDGSVKFSQLPFDGFWMLVVSTPELERTQRGDDVNGTVIVYHRASSDGPGQYRERLTFIASDTKIAESVERARSRVARTTPARADKPPTAPAAPRTRAEPPAGGPPPRPAAGLAAAGSAPPPLSERGPGAGGPPSRSADGGSSAGGAPPPPRPSGPPPRPSSR